MEFMSTPEHRVLTTVENVGQQDFDPPAFLLSAEVLLLKSTTLTCKIM